MRKHKTSFDFICASTALSKAAKLIDKRLQPEIDNFMEIVEIARRYLLEMEARNLSGFLHSLAKAGQCKEDIILEILKEAELKRKEFKPQNVSNTIWALATLNYHGASTFINLLLRESETKLRDFDPQELSNTIWALATLNYKDGYSFIKLMLREAETRLRDFDCLDLSNFIWALATLGISDESPFTVMFLKSAELKLRVFDLQNLACILWALATLNYSDGFDFIKKLLTASEPRLINFTPFEMSNTLWSLATLNYLDGYDFIKKLLKEAEPKHIFFSPHSLSTFGWSLAVLDHSEAPLFLTKFLSLAYGMTHQFANKDHTQSLQYLLLMEDQGHVTEEIKSDPQYVKFRRMCQEAEMHDITSKKQLEVCEAIRQLPGCSEAISEHLTEDGFFRIDIALQLNGDQKLAIEVDGPTHFLDDGKTLNGPTVLCNRLLENRGWKVISISVETEWHHLNGDEEKKQYLIKKLQPYIDL